MSKVIPQFIFTPDRVLSIRTTVDEDPLIAASQTLSLERFAEKPGIDIDNEGVVIVEVEEALGSNFGFKRGGAVNDFLTTIGRLIPFMPEDQTDRVINAHWLNASGFEGAVYPHFQKWLNTQSQFDERIALETITAMSIPLGKDHQRNVKREFRMHAGRRASTNLFEITIFPDRFGVYKHEESEDSYMTTSGEVDWNWVDLTTLGNCACFGVNGDDRQHVDVSSSRRTWLYEMGPHNIDFGQQTLSLLLGMGALAYNASRYNDGEDILANVDWRVPSISPKALS